MTNIKVSENLQSSSPEGKRNSIHGDETWAFTEKPQMDIPVQNTPTITAYDLFNLFTADIIRKKTLFTR